MRMTSEIMQTTLRADCCNGLTIVGRRVSKVSLEKATLTDIKSAKQCLKPAVRFFKTEPRKPSFRFSEFNVGLVRFRAVRKSRCKSEKIPAYF